MHTAPVGPDRRAFLKLTAGAGLVLAAGGCARSLPLPARVFPRLSEQELPFLGLATGLEQEYEYEARVTGRLPPELAGVLYRDGPGLYERAGWRKRAQMDGDGLVQAFRFEDGRVRYQARFVRTEKYVAEEAAGRFIYPTWSTQAPGGLLRNILAADRIKSQAQVTVFVWRGRLFAFEESSLPYEIDPATLETLGQAAFGLDPGRTVYGAHPKLDPVDGRWLHFGIVFGPIPRLHVTLFEPDGRLAAHRALKLDGNVYMHDFFATRRHLLFLLHPIRVAPFGFLIGRRSVADSIRWRPEKGARVLVLDRELAGQPREFEVEPIFMWHHLNAFEDEAGRITADFVGYHAPDHFLGPDPPATVIMQGRPGSYKHRGQVRRLIIDLAAGRADHRPLVDDPGSSYEWPTIHLARRCLTHHYGYFGCTRGEDFFWSSVARVEVATGRVEKYAFAPGQFCSEPIFAPIPGYQYEAGGAEPGWLLTQVYDGNVRRSFLAVLRADDLAAGPLARVELTHHVPLSLHGYWQTAV